MVNGLDKFKEYFAGYEGNYVLIGGAASNLIEEENFLVPRATKDLDIILVIEALTDSFVHKFWKFIKDAGYEHRQKGSEKAEFYRFYRPAKPEFPFQIELLSRKPDMIAIPGDIVVGPIPVGEELSSLSAIMLNDEYYHFTIEHSCVYEGVHIAKNVALIALKAKAYINLREAKASGQHINSGDITKHKNDVIRMGTTLRADERVDCSKQISEDIVRFFALVTDDLPNDDFMDRIGAGGITVAQSLDAVRKAFLI